MKKQRASYLWIGLALSACSGMPIATNAASAPTQTPYVIVVTATPAPPTAVPTLPALPVARTATPLASAIQVAPSPTSTHLPAMMTARPIGKATQTPRPTKAAQPVATATQPSKAPTAALPKLPKAVTATPPPLVAVSVQLTNTQATLLAAQAMQDDALPVNNVQVTFTQAMMLVTGYVSGLSGGPLVVTGVPVVENESMHFKLNTLTVNGREFRSYRAGVESAIDGIFRKQFLGKRVQSATLGEGVLDVVVLEKPSS